jgi:hypothetical protein
MLADKSIYDLIQDEYQSTYFGKIPQSVNVVTATPNILISNLGSALDKNKDKSGRYQVSYRIEVIGTIYLTVSNYAHHIISTMINYTDTNIYLIDFDGSVSDRDSEAEIYRIVLDFNVFTNDPVTS